MFLAHAPISFLANELIQKKKISQLKQNEKIFVGLFALICGILPDVDILILLSSTTPTFLHHTLISHTPFFYIGLWLLLKLIFWVLNKLFNKTTQRFLNPEFTNILINTFLIATLFHLAMDFFAEDVMLLYPFSTQNFTLFKYAFEPNLYAGYFFSISFGVEAIACAIFFVYIFNKIFKKNLCLKIVKASLLSVAALFFAYTVYIHFNTYNKSYLYDSQNVTNNDIDYDTLEDGMDMDVNNNGKDNIIDITLKDLVTQTEAIISTNKWTAYDKNSLVAKVKSESGGLNSIRLIAQAYWNIHSPINPVLKNQATKDGTVSEYSWNYSSLDEFYKYFNSKNMLIELNTDGNATLPQGAIFFVLNSKDEILNTGIVLENSKVGIVLPYDTNLSLHTINDVENYYNKDMKIMITK